MSKKHKRERWMVEELKQSFASTLNKDLADLFGVCPRTVTMWAQELGLAKDPAWLLKQRRNCCRIMRMLPKKPGRNGGPRKGFQPKMQWTKERHPDCRKAVIRLDTLQVYPSQTDAAKAVGRSQSDISYVCRNKQICDGTRWMLYSEYLKELQRLEAKPKWSLTAQEKEKLRTKRL